jgi:23S rRNA (adenine2030-N6)-methyltransferase
MNYRHAFHAGNFADVLKHAVLARIILHLRGKPAAFRVIDTHAGAGVYDLAGREASRGGEWRGGIGRLIAAPIGHGARALIADYLDAVRACNGGGRLAVYPGSPALVRALLRPQDRLTACELEPNAAAALARELAGDRRCKAVAIDGWTALNAYVPPKERRGLVIVDPPFEDVGDFPRLANALEAAHRKWASGSYLAWYPIKGRAEPDALARRLRHSAMAKVLRVELGVAAPAAGQPPAQAAAGSKPVGGQQHAPAERARAESDRSRPGRALSACGLIVINPPWTLAGELEILLPELAAALSGSGAHRVDMLAGEK